MTFSLQEEFFPFDLDLKGLGGMYPVPVYSSYSLHSPHLVPVIRFGMDSDCHGSDRCAGLPFSSSGGKTTTVTSHRRSGKEILSIAWSASALSIFHFTSFHPCPSATPERANAPRVSMCGCLWKAPDITY